MEKLLMNVVNYSELLNKEQEAYNYTKTASTLADYGFHCLYNHVDKHGADIIAVHIQTGQRFSLQLKGSRPAIAKKYIGKDLWIAYIDRQRSELCIYNHDEAVKIFESTSRANSESWADSGYYSFTPTRKRCLFEDITIRTKIS